MLVNVMKAELPAEAIWSWHLLFSSHAGCTLRLNSGSKSLLLCVPTASKMEDEMAGVLFCLKRCDENSQIGFSLDSEHQLHPRSPKTIG